MIVICLIIILCSCFSSLIVSVPFYPSLCLNLLSFCLHSTVFPCFTLKASSPYTRPLIACAAVSPDYLLLTVLFSHVVQSAFLVWTVLSSLFPSLSVYCASLCDCVYFCGLSPSSIKHDFVLLLSPNLYSPFSHRHKWSYFRIDL